MESRERPPTAKGPTDWFTGDVWIDGIVQPVENATLNIAAVHVHRDGTLTARCCGPAPD